MFGLLLKKYENEKEKKTCLETLFFFKVVISTCFIKKIYYDKSEKHKNNLYLKNSLVCITTHILIFFLKSVKKSLDNAF